MPQLSAGLQGDAVHLLLLLGGEFPEEMIDEQRDVVGPFPERRQKNGKYRQPVIEVLPESPLADVLRQVLIGGGNDADVDFLEAAADGLDFVGLERAQDLGLQRQPQLSHLVEEQRPLVGLFELPDPLVGGPGEGTPLVPEQLAFQQVLRDRRAVEGHERLGGGRAKVVNRTGDHLLARSAFSLQQHRDVAVRHLSRQLHHLLHFFPRADNLREPSFLFAQPCLEGFHLFLEANGMEGVADCEPQVVEAGRLGDKIVGPFPEGDDGVFQRAVGGHHDDAGHLARAVDGPQGVQPGDPRQMQVQHDQVHRRLLFEHLQRFVAGLGDEHRTAGPF